MKKSLFAIVLALYSTCVLSQDVKDDSVRVKIGLNMDIDGQKTVGTDNSYISMSTESDFKALACCLILTKSNKGDIYFINFSMPAYKKLIIKAGQSILFKQGDGAVLTHKTIDDIHHNSTMLIRLNRYTNEIGIQVSKQQLQKLIKGNISKIRISTSTSDIVDFDIINNSFSSLLQNHFNAIEKELNGNRLYDNF